MNRIFEVTAVTILFCAGVFAQGAPPGDIGPNVMFHQSAAMDQVSVTTGGAGGFLSNRRTTESHYGRSLYRDQYRRR